MDGDNKQRWLFAAIILATPTVASENLPLELVEAAAEHQCLPISDFLARPGMVEPPYVYGYLPGPKESSAVFWCRSTTRRGTFKLVVHSTGSATTDCPLELETRNYPGGLSLSDAPTSLNEFRYLEGDEPILNESDPTGKLIESKYDGVETAFYCHNGRWLVRRRH